MDGKWESFVNRVKAEARSVLANNKTSGIAIVTVHIAVNASGDPLIWGVRDGIRIEPSKDAASALTTIIGE